MISKRILLAAVALCLAVPAAPAQDVVARAMRDEMARSVKDLRLPDVDKPYFIAYRVDETSSTAITASLGALTSSNANRVRQLRVEVRAGDYKLDNTNFLTMRSFALDRFAASRILPLDNDYGQIRRVLWRATDSAYKTAAETMSAKRSVLAHRQASADLGDFLPEQPFTLDERDSPVKVDRAALEKMARDISAVFRDYPDIYSSGVALYVQDQYTRYLNSEGTWFTRPDALLGMSISAETRSATGIPLKDSVQVFARSSAGLDAPALLARARQLAAQLVAVRNAPTLDDYEGPVLFEGQAAGEAVAQVFAPALTSARLPITDQPEFETQFRQVMDRFGGNSLASHIGGRVLPAGFDVQDEPRLADFQGVPLLGGEQVDDDGVPTGETKLVEHGILKTVLSTRIPTDRTKASTGSRRALGACPSNLIVSVADAKSAADLKGQLLSMVKERGLPYGIVIRRVGPLGLSWTSRMGAMQLGGSPIAQEVYRVYPDGREELLREVEVEPLTPSAFKDIVAAGGPQQVYDAAYIPLPSAAFGVFGGSGLTQTPTVISVVTPSLLFDDVSLKKSAGPSPNPPVAPSPLLSVRQAAPGK